jgi:hypothetical protein
MIRWIGRAVRFGDHAAIWRAARPRRPEAGAGWFACRFLDASSVVVRRWGPSWVRRRCLFGREIGAWILALAWLGIPLAMALRTARSVFH